MKTLINVAFDGKLIIGPGQHDRGTPSLELVEIAFGRRAFTPPSGLYLSGHSGEQVTSEDRVRIITKSDGKNLVAGAFVFRGYRFFLNLLPQRFEMDGISHLMYHDSKLKFLVHNNRRRSLLSHQIAIEW